jgi:1,4-dihydroxy-2-naphthoate octaprenyltransferase
MRMYSYHTTMSIARHEPGIGGAVRALASQVHPVFMLPPLASSLFGALLAPDFTASIAALHLVAVFAGLYTAHVKDGYVDFHQRGEDDDHPLSAPGCRLALACASCVFFACLGVAIVVVDVWAGLVMLPGWLIGYLHAPQLDMHPVSATGGYPAGVSFALLGGYYLQAGAFSPTVVAFAVIFLVILSGIKVIDDAKDYDYDRSIQKRTVAVVLGRPRARQVAYGLMAVGLLSVVVLAVASVFPPSAVGASIVFAAVAALTPRRDPELATKLLVRGSYLFLAVLVAAVWFRPLL